MPFWFLLPIHHFVCANAVARRFMPNTAEANFAPADVGISLMCIKAEGKNDFYRKLFSCVSLCILNIFYGVKQKKERNTIAPFLRIPFLKR